MLASQLFNTLCGFELICIPEGWPPFNHKDSGKKPPQCKQKEGRAAWLEHVVARLLGVLVDLLFPLQDGSTALHLASWKGKLDVVKLLISRGANYRVWLKSHCACWDYCIIQGCPTVLL